METITPKPTKDGSLTFFNHKFQESYHAHSGAAKEAIGKHVEPAELEKRSQKQNTIHILDFCFGLGYNSAAAIDAFLKIKSDKPLTLKITGIENDKEILELMAPIKTPFESDSILKNIIKSALANEKFSMEKNNKKIISNIIIANAEDTIKNLENESFDIIFFDPFSPKKCPNLWTQEIFTDCYRIMKHNGILTTYSCAKDIRNNMKEAGFKTEDGPFIDIYHPGTLGIKS